MIGSTDADAMLTGVGTDGSEKDGANLHGGSFFTEGSGDVILLHFCGDRFFLI